MHFSNSDLVLPLHLAEAAFLEVLLPRFELTRESSGNGVQLQVEFDGNTPAMWNRKGRENARRKMARFDKKSARYKAELDKVLLQGEPGSFHHSDPGFPFRWASAGALPILNRGKSEFYCLFYRDIFPIGWNIANGATDTGAELLDPLQTLEREVGEELVILDRKERKRYVLRPDRDTLLDRPEFAVFRQLWHQQFPKLDIAKFQTAQLPLRWEKGPDQVKVRMGEQSRELDNCFVNINAADFGIELDRIARITVNDRLVLCDGEVTAGRALNRPVGLFNVQRLQEEIREGRTSFRPDFFYQGGERYEGKEIRNRLKTVLLPEMETWRSSHDVARFRRTAEAERLNLCPVTNSIIRRHMQATRSEDMSSRPGNDYAVFVSYAAPDQMLARKVYEALLRRNSRVFFAPANQDPGTWNAHVFSALESARIFVSVGTQVEHFNRPWPKYEVDAFHMVHLGEPSAMIIPFIEGVSPESLPLPLRSYNAIDCSELGLGQAIKKLLALIPGT